MEDRNLKVLKTLVRPGVKADAQQHPVGEAEIKADLMRNAKGLTLGSRRTPKPVKLQIFGAEIPVNYPINLKCHIEFPSLGNRSEHR